MSGQSPIKLSITSGGKPIVRNVSNQPAPPPERQLSAEEKARARADLARVYAEVLGVSAQTSDLLEAMGALPGAAAPEVGAQAMAEALSSAGLRAETAHLQYLTEDQWPALAQMTSGQWILVLGQGRAGLDIYDTTCTDNRTAVPLAEFEPYFTGLIVRAEPVMDEIVQRHVGRVEKPPHWFWGEFHQFRRLFGEIALGSFVANMLAVSVALFSLQVYDRVIPHQSESTLWVLAMGAGLALLMEAILKIARSRLMDGAGRQIELKTQGMLMDRLLGMRSDLRGRSPSQLFSAMREFGSVREFFTASTIGTLADIPFIFLFLALVASIAGNVVWVLVLGGILMVVPGFLMQKRMIRLTKEMQGASAQTGRLLQEALFELDTVKSMRAEDRFRRVWAELTTLSAIKSSDQRKLAATLTFWSQGVQQATYVGAVIMGTYLVFEGAFTVGSIIAVGILTGRTLAPLTQLSATLARWGNVRAALEGMESIAEAPQDAEGDRTYLRREGLVGAYELREVAFAYEDDTGTQVDIPGLAIQPGQRVAVLGPNGSGKSTFLKMLSGLYAPSSGRILLDGTEMSQIDPRDLRRGIGYLGQDVRLFAGSLRENLNAAAIGMSDDKLMEALDFAGLGPFARSHPKGLDLVIGEGGSGLSIGQRQSIGWARLWLQDPRVCLLDEPTAALDQQLEQTLVRRLDEWLRGRTAVIATHRVPILSLTSRTLILQNGRMVVDGPREEVMAHLARAGTGGPAPASAPARQPQKVTA